jgi:CheY-like chemotaxis protein
MLAEQGTELSGSHVRGAQAQLAGKRLLIGDDIATNRRILVKHALKWGMLPQAVASAIEALDLIRDGHAFDLAILDLSMPQMDGVQLARAIRQTRDAQALPLVLLTSMGQRQKQVEAAGVEFSAYLHKPIKPSQLFDTLMTLIGGAGQGSADDSRGAAGPGLAMQLPLDILVAEDNVINQKVVLRMLAHLGYQADTAVNGKEVLEALERRNYDAVLMDIQMPEMDGIETTQRILERYPSGGRPYVIAMTANALHGDRERFIASGLDDYLSKPIDIEQMARALQRRPPLAAPSSALRPGVIDFGQLQLLRQLDQGDGTDLCNEVIDQFLVEVPEVAAKLAASAQQGDGAALVVLAHRLGSTALASGARRVADVCMMLERAGSQGPPSVVQSLLQRLTREYEHAKAALIAEKARPAAAPLDGAKA